MSGIFFLCIVLFATANAAVVVGNIDSKRLQEEFENGLDNFTKTWDNLIGVIRKEGEDEQESLWTLSRQYTESMSRNLSNAKDSLKSELESPLATECVKHINKLDEIYENIKDSISGCTYWQIVNAGMNLGTTFSNVASYKKTFTNIIERAKNCSGDTCAQIYRKHKDLTKTANAQIKKEIAEYHTAFTDLGSVIQCAQDGVVFPQEIEKHVEQFKSCLSNETKVHSEKLFEEGLANYTEVAERIQKQAQEDQRNVMNLFHQYNETMARNLSIAKDSLKSVYQDPAASKCLNHIDDLYECFNKSNYALRQCTQERLVFARQEMNKIISDMNTDQQILINLVTSAKECSGVNCTKLYQDFRDYPGSVLAQIEQKYAKYHQSFTDNSLIVKCIEDRTKTTFSQEIKKHVREFKNCMEIETNAIFE